MAGLNKFSIIILAMLVAGCTKVEFADVASAKMTKKIEDPLPTPTPTPIPSTPTPVPTPVPATPTPMPTAPPPPTPTPSASATESMTVPSSGAKADVVFILDTTPTMYLTMRDFPNRLANVLSSWSNIDWQVGVMNADPVASNYYASAGRLMSLNPFPMDIGAPRILNPSMSDPESVFRLNTTFGSHYAGEVDAPYFCDFQPYCQWGSSQPLKQLKELIAKRADAANNGFFRANSYFVPVIISASDDASMTSAAEVVAAYNQSLASTMLGMRAYNFIVKPGDAACLAEYSSYFRMGAGGAYGDDLHSLALATGGRSESVCGDDYTASLRELGSILGPNVTSMALQHQPIAGSVSVSFSQPYGGTWSVQGNVVTFSQPLPAGTKVTVSYRYY